MSLDPISGIGKIPIEDLKGTENQYVDCIKTVMDGIVYPSSQEMLFANVEFIYSFNSPDGLTTFECSYEAVNESTPSDDGTGLDMDGRKVHSFKAPVTSKNKPARK